MGQHPVYNRVIKSKEATKMTHRELQTILKQLSEYQKNQISQTIQRFLALNQELTEIEPDTCPCCGDQNAVFIRKGILRGKRGLPQNVGQTSENTGARLQAKDENTACGADDRRRYADLSCYIKETSPCKAADARRRLSASQL